MALTRKKVYLSGFFGFLALGTAIVILLPGAHFGQTKAETTTSEIDDVEIGDNDLMTVETIKPRRDPSLVISSLPQPAYVEAYFQADLMARVAGQVKYIAKDKGDPVTEGELLLEIDVPELAPELAQKEAVVEQREQEVRLGQAQIAVAENEVENAENAIQKSEAAVREAKARLELRQKELVRYKLMAARGAVTPELVDEHQQGYEVTEVAWDVAKIAVQKARVDLKEYKAKLAVARADVKLKEKLVGVAQKDLERTLALADLAKIRAPFDGVITDRKVDPGSFVQNATTGVAQPFLSIARTDLVTVTMKLPDNYADFISKDTEAIIHLEKRPEELIQGRVTRFSPSIQGKDRIMQVEVDLYNGKAEDYHRLIARGVSTYLAGLAADRVDTALPLIRSSQVTWSQVMKGNVTTLPLMPQITDSRQRDRSHRPLLPGMYGSIRLLLSKFDDTYLLPSSAVISRGGKRYILQVKDHKAVLTPVRVQVDDGNLAKVVIIDQESSLKLGKQERYHDLTGTEEIIFHSQGEIAEGQAIRTIPVEWKAG